VIRIPAATLCGIFLALIFIYILRPLNNGAITLIVLICVGVANILFQFIPGSSTPKPKKG
jgi:hypothetical protein